MRYFNIHITRFILLVLALQILNLSVQSRPTNDTNDSFMLSHNALANPIDHAVEFIVERIMKKKNAFPEDTKRQDQEPFVSKMATFNLYFSYYTIQIERTHPQVVLMHEDIYKEGYHYLFASEINPPPPKA